MQFEMNAFNNNSFQPLTITPILHSKQRRPEPPVVQPKQPDLTFHCMSCQEFFVNPFHLYQHMNTKHPELALDEETADQDEDGEMDYSTVLEPVCELVDLAEGPPTVEEANDDDSSSDSDSDDSSSTSSSTSSSSSSSSSSSTSTSNSNTQDTHTAETTQSVPDVMEEAAYEEVEAESFSSNSANAYFPAIKFENEEPQESTSIILLNPPPVQPVSATPVIKSRRGRRSTNQVQLPTVVNGNQKCFQCTHCEASFPNAGDLSKHVRSHITNKPFMCSICQKTFTHIGSLNTHIRIHSGEKPYKCEQCSKAFTQSSSLMVHLRSHSVKKPHQCHLCDKGFVNSSSLVLHLKSHDDIETFQCPECFKEFKHEFMLEEHMRMHTQELVYQCSICRSAFRSSSELVQHMKAHLGDKPFTCSLCDRSFTQSGSLNIHMRIHTGEKPFECKLCGKAFTQASSLSVHMKIHSGEKPYPCHICGKSYSQQAYLNKHIQAHMGAVTPKTAETLVCIVCGSLHKNMASLSRHITQHHAGLMDNLTATRQHLPTHGVSPEERLEREMQYMQQVQMMLQMQHQAQEHAMLNMVKMEALTDDEDASPPLDAEMEGDHGSELGSEQYGIEDIEEMKEEYDDDYAAEEEVETAEQ